MTSFRTRTNQGKLLCVMAAGAIVLFHHLSSLLVAKGGQLLISFRPHGYGTIDCGGDNEVIRRRRRRPVGGTIRGTVVVVEWRNQTDSEHNTTMMEEKTHKGQEVHLLQVPTTAPSFHLRGVGNGVDKEDEEEDLPESSESLFAPSIYGMLFPEELLETYNEDSTREGNDEGVVIPTSSGRESMPPTKEPNPS